MTRTSYRLNASNAIRGAYGMLQLDTADGNGQKPVVRTRTKRSTPFKLACSKINHLQYLAHSSQTESVKIRLRCSHQSSSCSGNTVCNRGTWQFTGVNGNGSQPKLLQCSMWAYPRHQMWENTVLKPSFSLKHVVSFNTILQEHVW